MTINCSNNVYILYGFMLNIKVSTYCCYNFFGNFATDNNKLHVRSLYSIT